MLFYLEVPLVDGQRVRDGQPVAVDLKVCRFTAQISFQLHSSYHSCSKPGTIVLTMWESAAA